MTARAITAYVAALIQPAAINGGQQQKHPTITIMEAGMIDDRAYSPPQSITLFQIDHIRALRDACNEALGECYGKAPDPYRQREEVKP